MLRNQLDADRTAIQPLGDGERRPVACKRIQDEGAPPGRVRDDRFGQFLGEVDVIGDALRALGAEVSRSEHETWAHLEV